MCVAYPLGIIRVAFEVDDVEAARARLLLTGHLAGPVETWDMGDFGERKVVIFKDPDGIMLELASRRCVRRGLPSACFLQAR